MLHQLIQNFLARFRREFCITIGNYRFWFDWRSDDESQKH
jgi:hypothetical protein